MKSWNFPCPYEEWRDHSTQQSYDCTTPLLYPFPVFISRPVKRNKGFLCCALIFRRCWDHTQHRFFVFPAESARRKGFLFGFPPGLCRKYISKNTILGGQQNEQGEKNKVDQLLAKMMQRTHENRQKNVDILMKGLNFINKRGQPLRMMKKLELDPALMEQPLYF